MQGVGFRPFVKRLADRFGLPGVTFNTASGLVVEFEASREEEAASFTRALKDEAPVAARIESCHIEQLFDLAEYDGFQIVASAPRDKSFTLISADLATCPECLAEVRSPGNRRFNYPFTNCTNCGPRYSITLSTPYDRVNTTMRSFPMCADCAREYSDPGDRRFHAEPVACPACGPQLSCELTVIRASLQRGAIIALKGLGGFQLVCDAFCAEGVEALRMRKRRSRKPFAMMFRDVQTVRRYCHLDETEERALQSPSAPIVLLKQTVPGAFPKGVAPGLHEIGVMLPYTPLHQLLFSDSLGCLVMTSGNVSEEPIVIHNEEAHEKLRQLADEIVTHNRDIFMRVDDSVVRIFENTPRILRRARGFAPDAIRLTRDFDEILACGGELKSTFCLTKGRFAIMSQHIGDLESYETLQFFNESLRNLQSVYQSTPRLIAHDLHPDYLSSRWAQARPEPKIAIQHHHAHVAACMAENDLDESAIGVAFDGTGYGTDGQVWGGEFLICNFTQFKRCAHLRYVPMPGGDRAATQPWRMAAAYLFEALGPDYRKLDLPCWNRVESPNWKVLDRLIGRPALLTSSSGRLFDAVAAISGVSQESSYEGESAMLLEAAAGSDNDETYPFELHTDSLPWIIDPRRMLTEIAHEVARGQSSGRISRCFHNSIARMIEVVCSRLRERNGLDKVCLSGGTFQNFTLLASTVELLRSAGFQVFLHSKVPPNDGGLSLGQAAIAANSISKEIADVPRYTR